jgi:uncharacterized protein (DUF2235 family)
MPKTILIFSDGTGQIGGLRPDQRLSNIYKMYRATRPGPDSPISPNKQVAFYDHGLGAGETGGFTFKRLRNLMAAALGTGIDENVTDCYSAILSSYEPGDRVCLFGFSRGAYTVRALANVMNLCGVPTHDEQGAPVPRHGPRVRAIAREAVTKVYNHGAGAKRSEFEDEREILAARFRATYGSEGVGADGEGQGNVQPYFIGVFDTVAALGSRTATGIALAGFLILCGAAYAAWQLLPWWLATIVALAPAAAAFWFARILLGQFKIFLDDAALQRSPWDPRRWLKALNHGHMAWWTGKYYDRYVDREIRYLRHAISIDEDRAKFPVVGWGSAVDVTWNEQHGRADWLVPRWFAGNHSDIGGSYPEEESRLSDIALEWMVEEFEKGLGDAITILHDRLVTSPDALGLQHSERTGLLDLQPGWLRSITRDKLTWSKAARKANAHAPLHASVLDRLSAPAVPQMGEVKPYRPEALGNHQATAPYFGNDKSRKQH